MIRVLIVEDDPMVKKINEVFLDKVEGYVLYKSVSTIDEAKEEILNGKPELVLLDMFFQQGLGRNFLKWIRMNNIKCDVILITADKSIETVEEAFRYGAIDYILKPFEFNRFRKALLQYKSRRDDFKNIENIEQDTIDKIVLKNKDYNFSNDDMKDTKGVSQYTYERIIECINKTEQETITAQKLGSMIGVSRITARRYLDFLEKEGKVVLEMKYGKVGRPSNVYKVKNK